MGGLAASPAKPAEPGSARHAAAAGRLWLFGLAMTAPAVLFVRRYPLPGNTDKLVDIGKMASYGAGEFAGYVGGLAAMFVLYGLALRESRRLPAALALPPVLGCGAGMAAVWAWFYPVNAIDLFIYTARSRLLTTYGVNPMVARPEFYWDDPLMHVASREWADNVSPYGPLWNLIAAPFTLLGGDRLPVTLAGFKLLAVAALLAGGWLIARTLAATAPAAAATGALLYLWNPLVLWEGVGNGHNDVVMVVPLLVALLAWARRWDRIVIPALVTATLIKYVTVLLIPLAAIALWRRAPGWAARWRLALWSGLLSLLAVAVAFFPFYDLNALRTALAEQGGIYLTSPAAMAIGVLRINYPGEEVKRWATATGEAIAGLSLVVGAIVLWRRPDRLPRVAFEVIYVFLLVATWNFRPWYLIWPVALAALLPWGWPAWRMIAWTAGGLAGYGLFIWGWEWWGADFYAVQNVAVPLITGPSLLLSLAEVVVRVTRWGRARRPGSAIGSSPAPSGIGGSTGS